MNTSTTYQQICKSMDEINTMVMSLWREGCPRIRETESSCIFRGFSGLVILRKNEDDIAIYGIRNNLLFAGEIRLFHQSKGDNGPRRVELFGRHPEFDDGSPYVKHQGDKILRSMNLIITELQLVDHVDHQRRMEELLAAYPWLGNRRHQEGNEHE